MDNATDTTDVTTWANTVPPGRHLKITRASYAGGGWRLHAAPIVTDEGAPYAAWSEQTVWHYAGRNFAVRMDPAQTPTVDAHAWRWKTCALELAAIDPTESLGPDACGGIGGGPDDDANAASAVTLPGLPSLKLVHVWPLEGPPMPERKDERRDLASVLLARIRAGLPELEALYQKASSHWGYEDPVYRFYHQSFKAYRSQEMSVRIVLALQNLLPERYLNPWFTTILREGTGRVFECSHNAAWLTHTRPILEAFFHARHALEIVAKYGRQLETPPTMIPSGWGTVLYLWLLR